MRPYTPTGVRSYDDDDDDDDYYRINVHWFLHDQLQGGVKYERYAQMRRKVLEEG